MKSARQNHSPVLASIRDFNHEATPPCSMKAIPLGVLAMLGLLNGTCHAKEALTGYDEQTNGAVSQERYQLGFEQFNDVETPATGLGPVFNDSSCVACHHDTATGASSQIKAVRAGIWDGKNFMDPPGGSLILARALAREIKPVIPANANVKALRSSLSALGDGYIEAVADETLIAIANQQPALSNKQIRGEYVMVGVLETSGVQEVGRFGWKSQHSSVLSFSADAYRNEMGITTPLIPDEATSNGRSVEKYNVINRVPSPNESGNDQVELLADFIRATKAPPRTRPVTAPTPLTAALKAGSGKNVRLPALPARTGEDIFNATGCNICHVPSITTAPAGTALHGGTYVIPPALGEVTFHPYSDFLLHDVGTGDGIVQNGPQSTRNKLRTMPLWGLGRRHSFIHDGSETSLEKAVLRHKGEAAGVTKNYQKLTVQDKKSLLDFLGSL
ncbi:MAG: hypothetical protein RIQ52_1996 [Pseudomonadota bacterium]|jgi:CxxC motif-containing protein (DUF1111 family)